MVAPSVSSALASFVQLDCLLRLLLGMNIPKPNCLLPALWIVHLVQLKLKVFSVCIRRAELRITSLDWAVVYNNSLYC